MKPARFSCLAGLHIAKVILKKSNLLQRTNDYNSRSGEITLVICGARMGLDHVLLVTHLLIPSPLLRRAPTTTSTGIKKLNTTLWAWKEISSLVKRKLFPANPLLFVIPAGIGITQPEREMPAAAMLGLEGLTFLSLLQHFWNAEFFFFISNKYILCTALHESGRNCVKGSSTSQIQSSNFYYSCKILPKKFSSASVRLRENMFHSLLSIEYIAAIHINFNRI